MHYPLLSSDAIRILYNSNTIESNFKIYDFDEIGFLEIEESCNEELPYRHALTCEYDSVGNLFEILGLYDQNKIIKWMLCNGICPGQVFRAYIGISYSGGGYRPWGWDDVDTEIEFEVITKESIDPDFAAESWESFFKRRNESEQGA